MNNDATLLKEIALGNELAFKRLFDQYKNHLFNYLLRITKSREIAEEIIMDIFLKIWTMRDMIQEIQNIEAFLHKMAYNKAVNFIKMSSGSARLQRIIQWKMLETREEGADHKLLEGEHKIMLSKAIQQLSPQRRKIFTLSRMEGFTYGQIAQHLNLSRSTVRNTVADTLKIIRRFIGHESNTFLLGWLLMNFF